jgi:diguanylate cyclase (GGDEF)-like protein
MAVPGARRHTRTMDRLAASRRWLEVAFALAVAAVPAALAVAVSLLPPIDLGASAVPWLPSAALAAVAAAAAVAAVAALVPALRTGALDRLLGSGASAALAGGAVVTLAGAETLAPSVLASGASLAAASFIAGRVVAGGPSRLIGAAIGVMAVAEAVALLTAIPATASLLIPASHVLLALAAAAAITAAVSGTGLRSASAALLAAGAIGLLADDGASVPMLIGLAALVAGQLVAMAAALEAEPIADDDLLPELAGRLAEAVLRFDGHLRLRDWNAAAAALLGLEAASIGTRIDDLLGVSVADLPSGDAISVTRGAVGGLEVAMHRSGPGIVAVVHDGGGTPEVERLAGELRTTIEELLRARRTVDLQRGELERSATVDPLTGVASRGAILERLRIEVAQARRYRHPLAVVLLDVDRFGEINEAYGIAGGDAVLREVALRFRLRVREADALGRSGSDGFLAALPHTDEAGAATFADALRIRLGLRPVRVGDSELKVTVSIGVATMRPNEDLDLDGLLARVQEALDSARGAGGNRIALDRLHGLVRLDGRPDEEQLTDDPLEDDRAGE